MANNKPLSLADLRAIGTQVEFITKYGPAQQGHVGTVTAIYSNGAGPKRIEVTIGTIVVDLSEDHDLHFIKLYKG